MRINGGASSARRKKTARIGKENFFVSRETTRQRLGKRNRISLTRTVILIKFLCEGVSYPRLEVIATDAGSKRLLKYPKTKLT